MSEAARMTITEHVGAGASPREVLRSFAGDMIAECLAAVTSGPDSTYDMITERSKTVLMAAMDPESIESLPQPERTIAREVFEACMEPWSFARPARPRRTR